jgi:hypothetical protein
MPRADAAADAQPNLRLRYGDQATYEYNEKTTVL